MIRAWPGRFDQVEVELQAGATVADARAAAYSPDDPECVGVAVFGERAGPDTPLRDGDRVELLRALQTDPKDARRRRARDGGQR